MLIYYRMNNNNNTTIGTTSLKLVVPGLLKLSYIIGTGVKVIAHKKSNNLKCYSA